jgi:hypothetical protein
MNDIDFTKGREDSKEFPRKHIVLSCGRLIIINAKYRRDLETNNWHYYEQDNGRVVHFRKEHIAFVEGDTVEAIKEASKGTNNV